MRDCRCIDSLVLSQLMRARRYRVTGWIIRQMRSSDIAGHEYRAGDIVYDIRFERDDPTPMKEVIDRPTATEVDDYSEYKRLRKVHREIHSKGVPAKIDVNAKTKIAPPIPPLAPQLAQPRTLSKTSPSGSRTATFKRAVAAIGETPAISRTSSSKPVSPGAPAALPEELFVAPSRSTLEVPARTTVRPVAYGHTSDSLLSDPHTQPLNLQDSTSTASSNRTANSRTSDIREIAPWIEYDLQLSTPGSGSSPGVVQQQTIAPRPKDITKSRDHGINTPQSVPSSAGGSPRPRTRRDQRSKSIDKKRSLLLLPTSQSPYLKKKESRKSIFVRSGNPMAKYFDGAEDDGSEQDCFSYRSRSRTVSISPKHTSPMARRRQRASSSNGILRPLSPVPLRPASPISPLLLGGRAAISILPSASVAVVSTSSFEQTEFQPSAAVLRDDPFVATSSSRSPLPLPVSLREYISKPRPATAVSTPASTPVSKRNDKDERGNKASMAADRLKGLI